jgi:hypothetical protein
MDQADKTELLEIINSKFSSGMGVDRSDILRTKMELETAESQLRLLRSAIASEKNARYMLWAVIAAAVSALASLASTAIVVLEHH